MDTFDYHRSSLPARMPSQRGGSLAPQRYEGGAEGPPSPVSIRAVFRATRRYWWLILALWTVGSAGIGAAVYLKVKPQYRAFGLLRVEPTPLDLYGGGGREGGEPFMKTNVELIKSPNVLSAAAQEEKVRDLPRLRNSLDPQQELAKAIQVRILPDTTLIEVSMVGPSGAEAALLVNAVVNEFLANSQLWSSGSRQKQIDKLTEHYKTLQNDLQLNKDRLRERTSRSGKVIRKPQADDGKSAAEKSDDIAYTVDHYTKLMNQYHDAKMELLTAEGNLERLRQEAEQLSREAAMGVPPRSAVSLERRIKSDPALIDLARQAQQVNNSLEAARGVARNAMDPAVQKHSDALARLKGRIRALTEQKRQEFQEEAVGGSTVSNDPAVHVKLAEAEVSRLTTRRDVLEKELNNYKLQNTKQLGDEIDIRFLDEEHNVLRGRSDIVDRRLAQLKFEQEGDERIRKMSEARTETQSFVDKRFQYMAMAPVGILGAVLALVVLLEIRSGRVADTEVLSSRVRHEVFAIAPLPGGRPGLGFDGDKAEQRLARFVQSLDHLRVALCEGGREGEGRCVMITSATGGEGKTTLSAHLAARCANAGTSTLLIDGDLRRASLGRLLDVPAGMGLGDVLAGTTELTADLLSVQAGGFHFLSAGTPGIDPTRVLKSTRLAELVGQLRQMYDLVLIDTPPVLPVADALIMGRWADGAVMAARYDASRLPLVERASRQIAAAGIPVLGVVVNGVKGQDQAYGNYAYSYNYPGRQDPLNDPAGVS